MQPSPIQLSKPLKFLVVDDSRAIQAIVRRAILKCGYAPLEVRTALDGEQALEIIEAFVPDLVITDMEMPGGTGFVVLEAGIKAAVPDAGALLTEARDEVKKQTGAAAIKTETITRFTRSQIVQLVLLVALVYVAYPFLSTLPTFFTELRNANWWWALLGLGVSALTYLGAALSLWACADSLVSYRNLAIMQVANTFAATTTPAGVGGLALSTRFLQKAGLGTLRATAARMPAESSTTRHRMGPASTAPARDR